MGGGCPAFARCPGQGFFLLREVTVVPQGAGWPGTWHHAGVCLGSAGDLGEPGNPTQAKAQAAKKQALSGLMMSILS